MQKKQKVIIIAGPTAVGKTEASIELCKAIGGEVISADSMQVYRMMDIGSAKIRPEETEGIPHHLIDILDPKDEFNVFIFLKACKEAIKEIERNGHIPVIVGGTGFYIHAFLYDTEFTEDSGDKSYRRALEEIAEREGPEKIREMLLETDPESAEAIDPHNIKRMIRALEFFHETGTRISVHNREMRKKESPYDFTYYVLYRDREELYDRINKRVDLMMEKGLLDEVKRLKEYGCTKEMTSMQGLGYKQLLMYLNNECSLEEAVENIKIETRHFAKRQLTWFRREKDVIWVDTGKEGFINVFKNGHQ